MAEAGESGTSGARRLERLLEDGFLTVEDAAEVEATLELIARRVHEGSISRHFAELVIQKLADDKFNDWQARVTR